MNQYEGQDDSLRNILLSAQMEGEYPPLHALNKGKSRFLSNGVLWPMIDEDEDVDTYSIGASLITKGKNTDLLSRYSEELSGSIQFPLASIYLFGLGAIASAMIRRFSFDYWGDTSSVNLYVIAAQPPSTAKSAIVSKLTMPILGAYDAVSAENVKARMSIQIDLNKAIKDISKPSCKEAELGLLEKIAQLEEEMKLYPIYRYSVDDATPEGVEIMAFNQGNMFNIISAESASMHTILGKSYGGKGAKNNNNIFLKGWDDEHVSVIRGGRETSSGRIRGCVAVLAQDAAIEAILEAGQSGEGISERMLMLREKNMLGQRVHTRNRSSIDNNIQPAYAALCRNIVSEEKPVNFSFSDKALDSLVDTLNHYEPMVADGGKYSHAMLRGVIGKSDKQIRKIASVLHCINEWSETGTRSTTIPQATMKKAIKIFDALKDTYVAAADSKGFMGTKTSEDIMIEKIIGYAEKKKMRLSFKMIHDAMKNHEAIKGTSKLMQQIKTVWAPSLQERGFIVFDDKHIFINPRISE